MSDASFFYATGAVSGLFEHCPAILFPDGNVRIITSALEETSARTTSAEVVPYSNPHERRELLRSSLKGAKRVGINGPGITYHWCKEVQAALPGVELVDVSDAVSSARRVKDGKEIEVRTVHQAIKHGIAYATEDRKRYGLNLIDSIRRNISGAALDKLASRGVVNHNAETQVAERYRKELGIKTPNVEALAGKLSGGNQQKVVLSKWIYADPDVLILDEPTRGIDVGAKYEIYQTINRIADSGKGVIVISSELPELIGLCDRIYAISEGRLTGEVAREEATQERLMHFMTMDPSKDKATR